MSDTVATSPSRVAGWKPALRKAAYPSATATTTTTVLMNRAVTVPSLKKTRATTPSATPAAIATGRSRPVPPRPLEPPGVGAAGWGGLGRCGLGDLAPEEAPRGRRLGGGRAARVRDGRGAGSGTSSRGAASSAAHRASASTALPAVVEVVHHDRLVDHGWCGCGDDLGLRPGGRRLDGRDDQRVLVESAEGLLVTVVRLPGRSKVQGWRSASPESSSEPSLTSSRSMAGSKLPGSASQSDSSSRQVGAGMVDQGSAGRSLAGPGQHRRHLAGRGLGPVRQLGPASKSSSWAGDAGGFGRGLGVEVEDPLGRPSRGRPPPSRRPPGRARPR